MPRVDGAGLVPRSANRKILLLTMLAALVLPATQAEEWTSWRGPHDNGVSDSKGLISSWSPEGENLIWRVDLIGRSTAIVFDGRACVMGRTDEARHLRQEFVACFDADNGNKLWEDRYNIYNTTVPFQRVGWGSPVGDPETGYLYTMGVAGQLNCYDREGKRVWSYFLTEKFGRLSGYGGRTQTPVLDGDQLLLSVVNAGWGDQAAPRNRYFSFDKRTGKVLWISTPGRYPADMNTQSVPVVAEIGGRRLLVNGNADGSIYALDVATGNPVWEFKLSKRGINANVLVEGNVVYASHSEENLDSPRMGRVVAFDGTGEGDITGKELWRIEELASGFPSPAYKDGRLYVVDNSANLHAIDAATGEKLWDYSIGTVGKGSPVIADGKIYVTEVNGRFHILKLGKDGASSLDVDVLKMPDGRHAEIYASPAIAYGRIYFATEEGLYCLGDKSAKFKATKSPPKTPKKAKPQGPATHLQIVPAEIHVKPGDQVQFEARTFDAKGRLIGDAKVSWETAGLKGSFGKPGLLTVDRETKFQGGKVVARSGELEASARVRVIGDLPWSIDFDDMKAGRAPVYWNGAGRPWQIREIDGDNKLVKIVREAGLLRSAIFMGPPDWNNYTIQADVYGNKKGRRLPDMGLIANGYILDLMGNNQELQVRSWTSEMRMADQVEYLWEPETWYTIKMRVDVDEEQAIIRGKVWPRGEAEPDAWTIEVKDELPIPGGSPGVIGYSPAEVYFDNLKVMVNE